MGATKNFLYFAIFVTIMAMALILVVEAMPGRGGGRGGGSRGGGWGSSKGSSKGWGWGSSKKGSSSGWQGSSGGYKKKGSAMKTLKKAAVIGAVAYGGYQLGKLSAGFGSWGWGRQHGYGFNDWNRWREIDGFLCRENNDCNWIDSELYCQDYEFDFQPSALWFGGDVARIVGECACPYGKVFDDREMRCESARYSWSILLLAILIPVIVVCCCCVGGVCLARKLF